ncbi:MAG: TIGR00730 family Rossman fold protein [Cyanobacteria bacterium QS_8_64_29]|nr:MAG: TIGR00730 family Rossman fold protein [Cyanobacteria bacterium QS_8_64_29]
MGSLCVYAGSGLGERDRYLQVARALGGELAHRGIALIYGGGNIGLMGAMANSALAGGGTVIGIIPQALADKELAHSGLSELKIVASMHERKAWMAHLADAFVALPSGLGMIEEICEAATWTQLRIHQKACGVLNVDGFFDGLLAFLDRSTEEGFIRPDNRRIVLEAQERRR